VSKLLTISPISTITKNIVDNYLGGMLFKPLRIQYLHAIYDLYSNTLPTGK